MIVAVEGVSAAGKTTWASRFAPAVVDEVCAIPPAGGFAEIGTFWAGVNADRWQRAVAMETVHDVVCMDTDALKIRYSWCLWQIGEGSREACRANAAATRESLMGRRVGFADRVVLLSPGERVVREQKLRDVGRRRTRFELHLRLGRPLRRWYEMLERLAPGRVMPGDDAAVDTTIQPREDRYSIELYDEFVRAADLASSLGNSE